MDAEAIVARLRMVVDALDLLETLPTWALDGRGPARGARLAPAVGAALPSEPYGYDDYDPSFFESFEGASLSAIASAIDASFDGLIMLPPDTPQVGTEADDERFVSVRLGTPIPMGRTFFLWLRRRATHEPGQWVEEHYWVRCDERGLALPSETRFGLLEPWSREVWRRRK